MSLKALFGQTKGPQKAQYNFLIENAKQAVSGLVGVASKAEDFSKDDYRELNELIVVFLGGFW